MKYLRKAKEVELEPYDSENYIDSDGIICPKNEIFKYYDTLLESEYLNATHFNHHRLVAIDAKIVGELVQISVIPLNSRFQPSRKIIPFTTDLQPRYMLSSLVGTDFPKQKYEKLLENGPDRNDMANLFYSWMERKLELSSGKKLIPLAYNWAKKKVHIENWLGEVNFKACFHPEYRDILSIALFMNDWADINVEQTPFPKLTLAFICAKLHIEYNRNDDSILNAAAVARCYERMIHSCHGVII